MIIKLALSELSRSKKFVVFFAVNLALGLTGFVALESFKSALQTHMQQNARNILTADLEVSARRYLTQQELLEMRQVLKDTPESRSLSFYAMLSQSGKSRLVRVISIDDRYPFYGALELENGERIDSNSSKQALVSGGIWVSPEVISQMKLDRNAQVHLGQLSLNVADVVVKDSSQTFRGASFAPSVFIHEKLIEKSGLIQFGSTFSSSHFFKLNAGQSTTDIQQKLYEKLKDPGVQVETWQGAGEDSGRQLGYLGDYLGLVALVALFMSSLGASYIYRLYLTGRLKEIAIYRSLGLQSNQAVSIYLLQAALMGLIAVIPTLLFAQLVLPWLGSLLSQFLPFFLNVQLTARIVWMTLLMGVVGSLSLSLPFMTRIWSLKPARLFSEEKFNADIQLKNIVWFLPAIVFFTLLSIYQANSFKMGFAFVTGLVVTMALIGILGLYKVYSMAKLQMFKAWDLKYSMLGLARKKSSTMALFIALGLGSLLINILPQLKVSLQNEFAYESTNKLPSLFMFDIQDEQLPVLNDLLGQQSIQSVSSSALVRARILKINETDYERKIQEGGFKTREEEREARSRNRGVNLSYRHPLSSSETIVEGRPFSGAFDPQTQNIAELSVEFRFAERLGLKLGDRLLFDVQGIEIQGEIINFRKVKWTSFQPNFFILFQPGVLDEAPKTHIMALPAMASDKKDQLQYLITEKLGNVSMIDVSRSVQEVLKVAEQMSWSLELMAALALITGYVVLFSIIRSQVYTRRWEVNMMKVLGASFFSLNRFLVAEGFWIAFIASIFGAALSMLASWGLAWWLFEGTYTVNWMWPLWSILGITGLSVFISWLASQDIIREKPIVILRGEG